MQKADVREGQTRTWTEIHLLEMVRKKYPETKRMTYTGLVDWALRKLLEIGKA